MRKLYRHSEQVDKEFANIYRLIDEIIKKINELEALLKAKG